MREHLKLWMMAIGVGVLLPGLLFSVAEKLIDRNVPEETTDSVSAEDITETMPATEDSFVRVQQKDGTIETLQMEVYLTGVLLGEMPADFESEALKAQAVVARTYCIKRTTTGKKHNSGAVCTESSCCQAYCSVSRYLEMGGSQETINRMGAAVRVTAGEILTYNGEPIEATYFSCSGGRTEDAQAVWGTYVPYLQSVSSPGEENAAYYEESIKFTASEFCVRLGLQLNGPPNSWFGETTYTDGGGVDTMVIGGRQFNGTQLRQLLGLRSTAFTVLAVGESIHIYTKGFGHRVGMSQYGADAMAATGCDYREILAHYYPGTTLDN